MVSRQHRCHFVDVTHRYHTHARGVISGGAIAFDTPTQVGAYTLSTTYAIDPDGPVDVVAADGIITDLSGWLDEGGGHVADVVMWRSQFADDGGTWSDTWATPLIASFVNNTCNAHAAVALAGGSVLAAFENGSSEPDPNDVLYSIWSGSSWGALDTIFPNPAPQGVDDCAYFPRRSPTCTRCGERSPTCSSTFVSTARRGRPARR